MSLWLYPLKIVVVLGALVYGWRQYDELHDTLCVSLREGVLTIGTGVVVYLPGCVWTGPGQSWAKASTIRGAGASAGALLAAVRLFGAAVVPSDGGTLLAVLSSPVSHQPFSGRKTNVTPDSRLSPLGRLPLSLLW